MRLAALHYFIAIADYGSMSSAAVALGVSESALSQGIGQLERELGSVLFFRNGRSLCLTPAGKRALVPARRLVNMVSRMRGGTDGKVEGGKLDFLVEPALAVDPTAALVSEVRRRVANIQIRLRRGEGSSNQLQKLREGVSQFGIVYDIPPHPELATLPLGRHALWVVFPPGSDLEDGEGLTVEKLDGVSMVGVPRGAAQREFLDDVLRRSGVRTRMVVETDIRAQLIPLVLSGVGATIVPEAKALEAAMRGAVARKLFPSVGRTFELVWISEEVTPEMECVIGIAREMVESGKLGGGEVRDVLGECPSGGEESGTVSGLY